MQEVAGKKLRYYSRLYLFIPKYLNLRNYIDLKTTYCLCNWEKKLRYSI